MNAGTVAGATRRIVDQTITVAIPELFGWIEPRIVRPSGRRGCWRDPTVAERQRRLVRGFPARSRRKVCNVRDRLASERPFERSRSTQLPAGRSCGAAEVSAPSHPRPRRQREGPRQMDRPSGRSGTPTNSKKPPWVRAGEQDRRVRLLGHRNEGVLVARLGRVELDEPIVLGESVDGVDEAGIEGTTLPGARASYASPSDQIDHSPRSVRIGFNISGSRGQVGVTGEHLDIPQAPADQRDFAGAVRHECAPPRCARSSPRSQCAYTGERNAGRPWPRPCPPAVRCRRWGRCG